jgi:LPS-assembly lipoprotein
MSIFNKASILLATLILVSACGFTPKGQVITRADIQSVYLSTPDPYGQLTREVEQQLRFANIDILSKPDEQMIQLRIGAEVQSRRTLSLYDNAQAAEYEIGYSVQYQIVRPNKEPLSFTVNIHRDFLENPKQALASSREAELILNEMREHTAKRIIRRLTTLDP